MILFFLVAFLASIVGAICGIGGGVIIKPVLDLLHLETVSAIQFLSGCTVLSMSAYSVGRSRLAGERQLEASTGAPLIAGAVAGGLAGNRLFALVKAAAARPETVSAVQAVCLALVTLGTLVYTVRKAKIKTRQVKSPAASALIGLSLGNVIGANLFNLVLVSGVSVTLSPFTIPQNSTIFGVNASLVLDIPVMFAVMLLLTVPALAKKKLYRVQGVALLLIYAAFCAVQFTM